MAGHSSLPVWEEASKPIVETSGPHRREGVLPHRRDGSLAAPSPAARLIEMTQDSNLIRGYLGEACAEVRRLERENDRWHSFSNASFGGVPMAQYWCDLLLWESVLNEHPAKGIVEIGTWQGGLSWWLWAQCRARSMRFLTVDAVVPEFEPPEFEKLDVFARPDFLVARILSIGEPLILFCDGGNKPRELREFAPFLNDPASLIAVHDWGMETHLEDVPDRLEMVHGAFCEELGSITRFFRVAE